MNKYFDGLDHIKDSDKLSCQINESVNSNQLMNEPGTKYDADKIRYDLIPLEPYDELAKLYTMGAHKYGEWNWAKGMSWNRCFAALLRHLYKFWRGKTRDEETRCHHLASVAFYAFALMYYDFYGVGTDNRPFKLLKNINNRVKE